MSSLKDQLAKLGMIDETTENTNSSNVPRSWSKPDRTSSKSTTGKKTNHSNHRTHRGSHKSQGNRPSRPRLEPLPYRSELSDDERAKEIASLLKKVRLPFPTHGNQRFYFELRDGSIDYIDTDQESHEALSRGKVIIVSDPKGKAIAIPRDAIRELKSLDPAWIPQH